jgi:Protein of unknown function (DUF1822)
MESKQMNSTMSYYWTINLTVEAYEYAHKFSSQQANAEKERQVYLNTLAVWAVNKFVQEELSFTTDLKAGDSWNPVVRMVQNVADLVIPDLGIIECRPMSADDELITLPIEVQENRIAYVGVQFQEQINQVKLRGFITNPELGNFPKEIYVVKLKPIEELIDYLFSLETKEENREEKPPSQVILEIVERELEEAEEGVREQLKNHSLEDIVARLEYVYRHCDSSDWWDQGGRALAGGLAGVETSVRESNLGESINDGDVELRDFAEELLEKLAEIWGDAA